jgi:ATP-dependent DNA ligase
MAFQRRKTAAVGIKAPFPGFIKPALATSVDKVPSGARWLHEIKFDGYRVQVHTANAEVKVFTRGGNDTQSLPRSEWYRLSCTSLGSYWSRKAGYTFGRGRA